MPFWTLDSTHRIRIVEIADLTWHILSWWSCIHEARPGFFTRVYDMTLRKQLIQVTIKVPVKYKLVVLYSDLTIHRLKKKKKQEQRKKIIKSKLSFSDKDMMETFYLSISFSLSQLKWLSSILVIVAGFCKFRIFIIQKHIMLSLFCPLSKTVAEQWYCTLVRVLVKWTTF